jgi:hypothetical protein
MEENVVKELEALKTMVLNWKRSYLGWVPDDGEGEYLLEEFREEISTHVSPFVNRLFQNDRTTNSLKKHPSISLWSTPATVGGNKLKLMLRLKPKGGRACLRNAAWVFAGSIPCSSKGM